MALRLEHVAQDLHDLVGGRAPRLGGGVDFLERVDDVLAVKRDVRLVQGRAVAGVEGGVPLLVLVAEAHDDHVGLLDQRAGPDGVDLRRLVVAPEPGGRLSQVVACGIAGVVIGDRRREDHVQSGGLGAALDFLTSIGVDLAGKVHVEAHGRLLLH